MTLSETLRNLTVAKILLDRGTSLSVPILDTKVVVRTPKPDRDVRMNVSHLMSFARVIGYEQRIKHQDSSFDHLGNSLNNTGKASIFLFSLFIVLAYPV